MTTNTSRHLWRSAFILTFLLVNTFSAFAQRNQHTVSGKVTDEQGTPLEYATISFQNTNDPQNITGGITDPQGNFSIEVPEGTFNITVEFISFEPKISQTVKSTEI
jgi:hypothetical protein